MPSVLVTGAARGIGHATALRLAGAGWDVFAGVRSDADAEALRADRITPLLLDITSSERVAALGGALPDRLDAVVNNAGIVVNGPVEAVPGGELRRPPQGNAVRHGAGAPARLPNLPARRGR